MARAGSLPGPHLETQSFFIAFLPGLFSNKKERLPRLFFLYLYASETANSAPADPAPTRSPPSSAFLHYRMESSRIASPSIFLMVNTPSS